MQQIQTERSVRLPAMLCAGLLLLAFSGLAAAAESPAVFGIPVDFILFGMTLLGVALFHKYALQVALTGLIIIALYRVGFTGFKSGDGFGGLIEHLLHEWVIIVNLFCLLPSASWQSAFGLGFISSVFDNIPLTALALKQGGYDWGVLAYAVGFGGSMIWFGSSAGVALSNICTRKRARWDFGCVMAGLCRLPMRRVFSRCWA